MIPGLNSLTNTALDPKDPKVVAAKVESMFMEVMIKAMEDSVGAEDGPFGNSSSSEIYRGMFRQELGETLGSKVGGSIKDELEKAMRKVRETSSKVEATPDLGALPELSVPVGIAAPVSAAAAAPMKGLPISGVITSEVGWRKDPFTGAMALHKGLDIAAPQGTSIRAVASGTVVESGAKGGYGNAVVIRTDDGRRMLYGHNSANFVQVGDRVEQGQAIAAVGATGRATGPHVHFEVME